MNKILNFGLLGTGDYGKVHAHIYQSDPRSKLKYLWSPTTSRREAVAKDFDCIAARSWEEIVDDKSIDCVAVATPDYAHTEYAIAALNAGKHVILEKPMALTTAECKKIIDARDRSGKKLMINYHNRWYPAFKAAKMSIQNGDIGRPLCANFILSDTIRWVEESMKWADKSGPEWFLMSHIADLAFWILNDIPLEVYASAVEGVLSNKGFHTRDLVKAMLRMKNETVVHLESSWVLPRNWRNPVNEMWASIQGETGRIDLIGDYENITLTTDKTKTPFVLLELTERPPLRDFITCVLEDKPAPVTGEEGLLATQAIEAVVRSYKENRVVHIAE
jgi:predicted dehydrogenase